MCIRYLCYRSFIQYFCKKSRLFVKQHFTKIWQIFEKKGTSFYEKPKDLWNKFNDSNNQRIIFMIRKTIAN